MTRQHRDPGTHRHTGRSMVWALLAIGVFGCSRLPPPEPTRPPASAAHTIVAPTPTATSAPTVAPTPAPTVAPTPSPAALDLGPSGTWITVAIQGRSITATAVRPDGEQVLLQADALDLGVLADVNERIGSGPPAVSVHGILALPVERMLDDGSWRSTTALVDLRLPDRPATIVPGREAGFGPTGMLVTVERDPASTQQVLHVFLDGATSVPAGVAIQGWEPLSPSGGGLIFAWDGSGVHGTRLDGLGTPVVIGWDGRIRRRGPDEAPYAARGNERQTSIAGEWISTWCGDGPVPDCGADWVFPDGATETIELPGAAIVQSAVWSADGRTAIVSTDRGVVVTIDTRDRIVRPYAATPPGATGIVGLIPSGVLLRQERPGDPPEGVVAVGPDSSAAVRVVSGQLALVVP